MRELSAEKASTALLFIVACLLSGCLSITDRITPENTAVKPMRDASECTYIVLGFGLGENAASAAMEQAVPPIRQIRSITIERFYFFGLLFGYDCVTVVGE